MFFIYCNILENKKTVRPLDGCPIGTDECNGDGCPNTCFCEDHCSWKICKLEKPPKNCLMHTNRKWHYNQRNYYWETTWKGDLRY